MKIIAAATGACVEVTSRVSSADSAGRDTLDSLFVKVSVKCNTIGLFIFKTKLEFVYPHVTFQISTNLLPRKRLSRFLGCPSGNRSFFRLLAPPLHTFETMTDHQDRLEVNT